MGQTISHSKSVAPTTRDSLCETDKSQQDNEVICNAKKLVGVAQYNNELTDEMLAKLEDLKEPYPNTDTSYKGLTDTKITLTKQISNLSYQKSKLKHECECLRKQYSETKNELSILQHKYYGLNEIYDELKHNHTIWYDRHKHAKHDLQNINTMTSITKNDKNDKIEEIEEIEKNEENK
jgi:chromosome segregation ATPase